MDVGENLKINDITFTINRLIAQAPRETMIREFIKNAEENAALLPEGQGKVWVYPTMINGVRKISFKNNGIGMDDNELKTMSDFSSSINKTLSLDENFGIGAKVSGLAVSPLGLRYRSCKNGIINQMQIGYDKETNTYKRFAFEVEEDIADTIINITDSNEFTEKDRNSDWTEVVLLGENDDHDTVKQPLMYKKNTYRSFVATSIFKRFASFKNNVSIKVDTSMTKGGGRDASGEGFRTIKTLNSVLDQLGKHEYVNLKDDGIQILYLNDPMHEKHSHKLSALSNPAVSSNTFCSLVYKGERYDHNTESSWATIAPKFGVTFGSKVLSIEIHLLANEYLPTQYRDGLTDRENKEPILCEQFAEIVRENIPEWFKNIIKEESPKIVDNYDDIRKELQSLLDQYKVPVSTLMQTNDNNHPSKYDDKGLFGATSNESNNPFPDEEIETEVEKISIQNNQANGNKRDNKKLLTAPEGSKSSKTLRALETVPNIHFLYDEKDLKDKDIISKAGRYYKETQDLFVNANYDAVKRMEFDLFTSLQNLSYDIEIIRKHIKMASERAIGMRVGKAVCYSISKKLMDHWTMDDLEKATSPESLSISADDYRQSIPNSKRYIVERLKSEEIEFSSNVS